MRGFVAVLLLCAVPHLTQEVSLGHMDPPARQSDLETAGYCHLRLRGGAASATQKGANGVETKREDRIGSLEIEKRENPRRKQRELGRRVQLHRALSKLGLCSRTLAWKAIKDGRVSVDGRQVLSPLAWVDIAQQAIALDGGAAQKKGPCRVWKVNKPRGLVTARTDDRGRATIFSLFPEELSKGPGKEVVWRFPVGRLDAESEGLLLFSTDGQLSNALTAPETGVNKTYHVWVRGIPAVKVLKKLSRGVVLDNKMTRPALYVLKGKAEPADVKLEKHQYLPSGVIAAEQKKLNISPRTEVSKLEVTIHEGRHRQIRRVLASEGIEVLRLQRTSFGPIELGGLLTGQVNELSDDEIHQLKEAVSTKDKGR